MKLRSEIEEKYKWDLSKFCESDAVCKKRLDEILKLIPKIKSYKGKLANKKSLLEYLQLIEKIELAFSPLYLYVNCNLDVDLSNSKYNELMGKCTNIESKISVASSFFEPELLALPDDYLKNLTKDENFKNYWFYFKKLIKGKKHILSFKEESILSRVTSFSDEFSGIYENLTDVDLKYEDILDSKNNKHPMNESLYGVYMLNEDRVLRRNASLSLIKAYFDVVNTTSANYIASVKKDWFFAEVSKYKSVFEAATFSDNIKPIVYEKLIANVHELLPFIHQYYKLRAKKLGLTEMYNYDTSLPISNYSKNFSYEDACKLVENSLSVMGSDYIRELSKAFTERWIDVFPNKNKRSGGYQNDCYGHSPVILLNFNGTLREVFTIAHELGHAMHSVYSGKHQCLQTASYTIFVAEVASVVNEVIMLKSLYGNAKDKNEKIYYLDRYLQMFKNTFFTQSMFSEFEDYAHKLVEADEAISKDILNLKYKELLKTYNGPILTIDELGTGWTRIPHFYRPYYVYKYATGFVSAITIANHILNEGEKYLKKYKNFLSSGGSKYSIELLKGADVNLETNQPYEKTYEELSWALNELKKLI